MCAVFRYSGSASATWAIAAIAVWTCLRCVPQADATTLRFQILTGKIPTADILAEIEIRQALEMGRIPPVLNVILEKDYSLHAAPDPMKGSYKLPDGSQLFFSCQGEVSEEGRSAALSNLVFAHSTGKESQFPAKNEVVTGNEPLVKDQTVSIGNTAAFYFLLVTLLRD